MRRSPRTTGALVIEGPAGIGKTGLLRAAAERARAAGMTVLAGRGSELEDGYAWGVVRQLFEHRVAALPAGAAGLAAPALGLSGGSGSDPDAAFATLHGLYWLTADIVRRGPALIAVDDVQWSDLPSLRFLGFLALRLEGLPVVLIATARSGGAARRGARADRPPRRGRPGAGAQARAAEPARRRAARARRARAGRGRRVLRRLPRDHRREPVPAARARRRAGQGEGDAHRLGRRTGQRHDARGRQPQRAPPPRPRIGRRARALARGGGARPRDPARRAAALAGIDMAAATDAAAAAIAADILEDAPTPGFLHPILRAAVLGDLAAPERARWHARAARCWPPTEPRPTRWRASSCSPPPPPTRGRCACCATPPRGPAGGPPVTSRRRSCAAPSRSRRRPASGRTCSSSWALAEAADDAAGACAHLEEALGLVAGGRRPEVAFALARVLLLAGRFADAADVLEPLMAELGDDDSQLACSVQSEFVNVTRWEPSTRPRSLPVVERLRARALAGEQLDPRLQTQVAIELAVEGA